MIDLSTVHRALRDVGCMRPVMPFILGNEKHVVKFFMDYIYTLSNIEMYRLVGMRDFHLFQLFLAKTQSIHYLEPWPLRERTFIMHADH